jgi:hypothetical protein
MKILVLKKPLKVKNIRRSMYGEADVRTVPKKSIVSVDSGICILMFCVYWWWKN